MDWCTSSEVLDVAQTLIDSGMQVCVGGSTLGLTAACRCVCGGGGGEGISWVRGGSSTAINPDSRSFLAPSLCVFCRCLSVPATGAATFPSSQDVCGGRQSVH